MVKPTARLRACGGAITASAAKPAGKNHTARAGWMITTALIQLIGDETQKQSQTPVTIKLTTMVRFGPSRSEAQPPSMPNTGP